MAKERKVGKTEFMVKTTVALTEREVVLLRTAQMKRRVKAGRFKGEGLDLGALIREAIRAHFGRA